MTRYIFAVFLIFGLLHHEVASTSFLNVRDINVLANSVFGIYDSMDSAPNNEDAKKQIIRFEILSLSEKLTKMGIDIFKNPNLNAIYIPEDIQMDPPINDDFNEIFDKIADINYLFKEYFLPHFHENITVPSFNHFLEKATSTDTDSPQKSVYKIHQIMYPRVRGLIKSGLIEDIAEKLNTRQSSLCEISKNSQQIVYDLYYLISIVELKAIIMISYAYTFKSVQTSVVLDVCKNDIAREKYNYLERIYDYLTVMNEALNKTSLEVSNCKPVFNDDYTLKSLKALSLLPKESDYRNNMVVVGVRFVAKNEILHLQIQEGNLVAGGKILPGSEKWILIDDMNYEPRPVNENPDITNMTKSIEYHPLFSMDTVRLTDLKAPKNYVVVGANFEAYALYPTLSDRAVLYLRLKYANVNFTTGHINPDNILYTDVLNETTSELDSLLDDDNEIVNLDKYLDRGIYSWRPKLSYMDSQAVYTSTKLPVTGIGFYKNDDDSEHGISISMRIFPLNISELININNN